MAKNDIAIKERYITEDILNDLKKKMVFVGGPRQVGKTTMSLYIADNYYNKSYQHLNWHNQEKDIDKIQKDVRIMSYDKFLSGLI